MARLLKRSEVPVEETWNLGDIFPTREAWEAELKAAQEALPSVVEYRGRLAEGAAAVLGCLTAREHLAERATRIMTYAMMNAHTDGSDPVKQGDAGRAFALAVELSAATTFVQSELIQLPEGALERFRQEEPGLKRFGTLLEDIAAQKPHALHPVAEETIAALGEALGAPNAIFSRTTSADLRFENVRDSEGQEHPLSLMDYFLTAEVSPDTTLRRNAYAELVKGLTPYKHTLATTLATEIKRNVVTAKLRKYDSVFDMLLYGESNEWSAPDYADRQFFDTVMDTIQTELAPHMQRYARLRKRNYGLDKLLVCDVKAPVDPGFAPQLSYEEGAELIESSVALLGPEYRRIVQNAFKERWIDRAQNEGRAGMLYCNGVYGVHPYVFSTWTGTVEAAFGLAHELGHAAHMELTMKSQPFTNARFATVFVETPSTLGEHLLAEQIKRSTSDPRMHRYATMMLLNTYHHNFVTHLLEAELLRRLYTISEQGQPITAATLCHEKSQILSGFWGDTVEIDEGAGLTWMRQPHYYMGLYPYTYSVGLVGSTMMARMLKEEGEPAARRYVEALKSGCAKKPMELFASLGIDMTNPDTIRQAVAHVGSLISELESSFERA